MLARRTGWTLDTIDALNLADLTDLRAVWPEIDKAEAKARA